MSRFNAIFIAGVILLGIMAAACGGQSAETRLGLDNTPDVFEIHPTPSARPLDPNLLAQPASALCDRLGEIRAINRRVPEESDDLYRAILAKGDEALPCLIARINDATKTPDPRSAPVWQHYAIGDTAIFIILDIVSRDDYERWEELFLGPLPNDFKDEWATNGVYAYFNYVSEPKNRSALQKWWQGWLKKNAPKQLRVDRRVAAN